MAERGLTQEKSTLELVEENVASVPRLIQDEQKRILDGIDFPDDLNHPKATRQHLDLMKTCRALLPDLIQKHQIAVPIDRVFLYDFLEPIFDYEIDGRDPRELILALEENLPEAVKKLSLRKLVN